MRLLVIEDNQDISASIFDYFEGKGAIMDSAADGITGLHLASMNTYDVIVLDLGLPGIDGLDLCRRLRADADRATPVLMLTARDTLEEKLDGFEAGADDYLVKPFALQELAARVTVLTNRTVPVARTHLEIADLTVDIASHEVSRAGCKIDLNPTVFNLLVFFLKNQHRVLSRSELEYALWQDEPPDSDALRTHLSNLRSAIDRPFNNQLIHTIRGFGYKMSDRVDASG